MGKARLIFFNQFVRIKLDDAGQFNEAGCKEHVDKVYPEKYRADALEKMKKCSEDHCEFEFWGNVSQFRLV